MSGTFPKCPSLRCRLQTANKYQVGRRKWVKKDPRGTQTKDKIGGTACVGDGEKRKSTDKQIKGETAAFRHLKGNDRSGDAGWSW